MRLRENIARNAALRENVFMMAICIELKIPLFIVGKPGSSKSLAKSIIQESMKGRHSHNQLMKLFKEIDLISYQCSHLSTSESVIDVFNTAKKFQDKQDSSEYTAVVVLDEVGLAEDSPYLPLKALHPLLEDGTSEGGSSGQDIVSTCVWLNQYMHASFNFIYYTVFECNTHRSSKRKKGCHSLESLTGLLTLLK